MTSPILNNDFFHPHNYEKHYLQPEPGKQIPVHMLKPKGEIRGWVISLHGITDKTENWLSIDAYGFGLSIHRAFLQEGWAVIAPEYMDHGERGRVYPDFMSHFKAILQKWDQFYDHTLSELKFIIDYLAHHQSNGQNPGVFGFSLGGLLSLALASIQGQMISCAVSCACPVPDNPIDAGSPQIIAPKIDNVPVLLLAADRDVHSSVELNRKVFELLKSQDKHLMIFSAEHQMVPEYIPPCLAWMRERMKGSRKHIKEQ
ncbi:MAG: dienelactone hydrolase family protein [Spirochaetales bacterium]|nr:dienelactone hydrolase family protein [Spirochaetales bacterium]